MISDGYLTAESGHEIYFHEYGNPGGVPILMFHGGPGNFSKARHADIFDAEKHRVILFDQRGCGKSKFTDRFMNNNLDFTVWDAKRILDHLGVEKVNIVSESWGSACALHFAKKYRNLVNKIILSKIFLGDRAAVDWLRDGWLEFYPDLYEFVYKNDSFDDFVRQANSDDNNMVVHSTKLLGSCERWLGNLEFSDNIIEQMKLYMPSEDHIKNYQMYLHYLVNVLPIDPPIIDGVGMLGDMDITIIHNRLDLNSLFRNAWELHKALPNAEFIALPDIGHDSVKMQYTMRETIKRKL
ncbi:MAG: alpha/beta fold hydrolase [Bacteroidales bacterium]|nr:alpha/beta fold hydrolase [Bacteroidales bacterium]